MPRSARRRTAPSRPHGGSAARGSRVHRGRLRAGGHSRAGDRRARRVRPAAQRPLPPGFQHQLGHVRLRGARLHLPRTDIRPAARGNRPLRRAARRLSRGPGLVLHPRRQVTRGLGARVRPHGRGRGRSRPPERRAHPLREVHAGRRDARHLHRPRRPGVHAALCARRVHRHLRDRRISKKVDRFRSPSSCSSCAPSVSSSGSGSRSSACGCAPSGRTRRRRGASACRSTGPR